MANFTLNLTRRQFEQLHRVLAASMDAHSAGIHPQMSKRSGGKEGKTKAEIRHFRANMDIFALLKAATEPAPQPEQELPEPLRTILAGLKEEGIGATDGSDEDTHQLVCLAQMEYLDLKLPHYLRELLYRLTGAEFGV